MVNVLTWCPQGYNATLLAYGQTGSGKSYSMVGYGPNKGLVPKLCERLFQAIRENQESRQCQVKSAAALSRLMWRLWNLWMSLLFMSTQVFFSMLEIYNEQVTEEKSSCFLFSFFFSFLCDTLFISASLLSVQVVDLLSRGSRTLGGLRVREEQQRGFYVEGLRTVPCENAPQVKRWRTKTPLHAAMTSERRWRGGIWVSTGIRLICL